MALQKFRMKSTAHLVTNTCRSSPNSKQFRKHVLTSRLTNHFSYCPEDEINAPFVPAPPAPEVLPLPIYREVLPYAPPAVLYDEYGELKF